MGVILIVSNELVINKKRNVICKIYYLDKISFSKIFFFKFSNFKKINAMFDIYQKYSHGTISVSLFIFSINITFEVLIIL